MEATMDHDSFKMKFSEDKIKKILIVVLPTIYSHTLALSRPSSSISAPNIGWF